MADGAQGSPPKRESAEVVPGRVPALPHTQLAPRSEQAISSLYYKIASQRLRDDPVALQFVAVDPASGTSVVASQFASYASRFHGGLSLLVDCSAGLRPCRTKTGVKTGVKTGGKLGEKPGGAVRPGLVEAYATTGSIEAAVEPVAGSPDLHVARLTSNAEVASKTNTELFAAVLGEVRRVYQFTALDTPALEETAFTLTFSRASDGVVLVLAANSTKWERAEAAAETIERSGGKILGIVFNKRRSYMPKWLYKRI